MRRDIYHFIGLAAVSLLSAFTPNDDAYEEQLRE